MRKNGLLLLLLLAIFAGCTETAEVGPADAGKEYFPLRVGASRSYRVMEKRIQQNKLEDSVVYFLQERVDSVYKNLAGEDTYRIIRARKNFLTDAWLDDSLITVTVTSKEIRRHENNITFLKMVFPAKEGKSWSQNLYNELEYDTIYALQNKPQQKPKYASYTGLGQPKQVGSLSFPNTATVLTVREPGNIYLDDRREEVYAEGIGLVYKHYNILEKCDIETCGFDPDYTLRGLIRIEEIISYEN